MSALLLRSEVLFTKVIKDTDVNVRLSWPSRHLDVLRRWHNINLNDRPLDFEDTNFVEFDVFDVDRRTYRLGCTTRRITDPNKPYLKPVLSRGWKRFVKANNIQIGDKITCYKNLDPSTSGQVPFIILVNVQ